MMDACILAMTVLAMSYTSDEPRDLEVYKCGSNYIYMIDRVEVAYIDKLKDSEIYIYGEKK